MGETIRVLAVWPSRQWQLVMNGEVVVGRTSLEAQVSVHLLWTCFLHCLKLTKKM